VAEFSPTSFDVPIATFEPWARQPSTVTRWVRLRNVSSAGASSAALLQLVPPKVLVERADGGFIGPPVDGVFPEVDVGLENFIGLGLGQSDELPIRVTPPSVGPQDYRIHFFTNDPLTPKHVVSLSLNAVTLGRCAMRIEPPSELRLSGVGGLRSLGTISFINQGNTRCVVDAPRVSTGFGIVAPVSQLLVEPGQTGTLTIEGPQAGSGYLTFHVLNTTDQPGQVRLVVP
jgi:hypothetical protein